MNDEIKETEVIEEIKEEKPISVFVGEKEYFFEKKGIDEAEQVSAILGWLGKYGAKLTEEFSDDEGNLSIGGDVFSFLGALGKLATPQALIDLFVVAIGCSRKEAEEYFDIGVLVDGVEILLAQEKYAKIVNRFFSTE